MAKFHINTKTGEPGKCSATKGGCPFGTDAEHFTSIEAARSKSEELLESANGWAATRKETVSPEALKLMGDIEKLENNPARHHYGFPEDEMTRYNIDKKIGELKSELRGLISFADFSCVRNTVKSEDRSYAIEQVAIQLGNTTKEYKWEAIMGADTRRTAKAITEYENIRNNMAANNPDASENIALQAKRHRDQEAFARAFKHKYEIPEQYEKAFQDKWDNPKTGQQYFNNKLKELVQVKADYTSGKLSATKIVGSGLRNPTAAVHAYFDKSERTLKRAIATEGRSDYMAVTDVMHRARAEKWPLAN